LAFAQLEPLTFWGHLCFSAAFCGCLGFLRDVTGGHEVPNVIVADYTNLETHDYADIEDMLQINRSVRDEIEAIQSEKVAMQICSRLPKNEQEIESMIQSGYELAKNMSWDTVVNNYLLNNLQAIPANMGLS